MAENLDYAKEAKQWREWAEDCADDEGPTAQACRIAAAVFEERVNTLGDQSAYGQHLRSVLDRIIAARDEQARAEGGQVAEVGGEKSASGVVAGATGCEPAGFGGDVRTANEAASPQGVSTAPSAAPLPDVPVAPPPAAVPDGHAEDCPCTHCVGSPGDDTDFVPVPDGDRVSLPRFGPEDAREFGRYVLTRWPVPTEREVADWWNARLASKEQP